MVRSGAQRKTPLPVEPTASMEGPTISRKSKFRYLTARGENFEKQLADLLQSLSGYARRTAKLRDSGDMLAEALNGLSMAEVLNPSFKRSTSELSKTFRTIQDHRDSQVLYFEDNFLPSLAAFGESLQKQREEVKSNTNKVFDGKRRSSIWSKSSSSNSARRRSQSAERAEKPSKEEKALQQSIQRYELRRNLVLRKMLLKLVLSELRFTVHSFNSLTHIYKQIHQNLSPVDDLKVFNEFCHFRGLGKTALNEVEGDVSGVESNDDEDDDDADDTEGEEADEDAEDSDESGLEENNSSSGDTDRDLDLSLEQPESRRSAAEEESESSKSSKSDLVSIQSTLRRFNSTPEIPISSEEKGKGGNPAKKSGKKSGKSRQTGAEKAKVKKRSNSSSRRQGEASDAEDDAHSDANETTRSTGSNSSKGRSFFK